MLSKYPGPHLLSVHASGGKVMCGAALKMAYGSNVNLAAVTVLTSMAEGELHSLGFRDCRPGIRTHALAEVAADCMNEYPQYDANKNRVYDGINHFICAPNQLALLHDYLPQSSMFITPGIRSDTEEAHDHARTKPASFALKNGANWLVVGRPITKATNPAITAQYFEQQAIKYG